MGRRVLILSWEYPPIVEGGLARHVRKLAEGLVARRASRSTSLTRGARRPADELRAGVHVHRVAEPATPRDLDAFLRWIERMNERHGRAGRALADGTSTSCTATTGSSPPPRRASPRGVAVPT